MLKVSHMLVDIHLMREKVSEKGQVVFKSLHVKTCDTYIHFDPLIFNFNIAFAELTSNLRPRDKGLGFAKLGKVALP